MTLRKIGLILALPLALLATGCGDDDDAPEAEGPPVSTEQEANDDATLDSENPFVVGVVAPTTGRLADSGRAQLAAMRAAAEAVNSSGGIDGREVQVVHADDQADPTKTLEALQRLDGDHDLDMVVPGITSSSVLASVDWLTEQELLSFAVPPTAQLSESSAAPFHFMTSYPTGPSHQSSIRMLKDELGAESVALLVPNDALGKVIEERFPPALEAEDIEVTGVEVYDPTGVDYTSQINKLRDTSPGHLVISGFGASVGVILDGIAITGWDVPTFGGSDIAANNLCALTSEDRLENLSIQAYTIATTDGTLSDKQQILVDALAEEGVEAEPLNVPAGVYDSLLMVQLAAERAGSSVTDDIIAELESFGTNPPPAELLFLHENYAYTAESHQNQGDPQFTLAAAGCLSDGTFNISED